MSEEKGLQPTSQILIYQSEDGQTKIEVQLQDETVWLSQKHMAELFQTSKQNIGQHLRNIFEEGELNEKSVVKKFFTTAADGKKYRTAFYSLDERLKNPDLPFDYFDELLRRIQDIRTSEKRFYRKITDIYATSIDYDPTLEISINFFKTVQNKMHWAITGQTAAEIIHKRADHTKANMGLTNWRGAKVRKQDVVVAKNYLNEDELLALNNLVEQYLVFAEGQAMRRIPMRMADWIAKLDGFLSLNDRNILEHAGKISHQMAKELAEGEYDRFHRNRLQLEAQQADEEDFEQLARQIEDKSKERRP